MSHDSPINEDKSAVMVDSPFITPTVMEEGSDASNEGFVRRGSTLTTIPATEEELVTHLNFMFFFQGYTHFRF